MESLNLPSYSFTIKSKNSKPYVFDEIRKKYVLLTPEEWVRQHFVAFLVHYKKYPSGLLSLEKSFLQNKVTRRSDIIVYNSGGKALMLIECKAPQIELGQLVFDQAAAYNLVVKAPILVVSNGLKHYCFKKDQLSNKWIFLENIPDYDQL